MRKWLVAAAFVCSIGLAACGGGGTGGSPTPAPTGGNPGPSPTPTPTVANGPNVIVMVADDLGWRDLGYAGSDFYDTPNIDRLAASGVRFTQAYSASPVCSPTRAALLSGMDPVRLGMTTIINDGGVSGPTVLAPPSSANRLDLSVTTMAEDFKAAGYRTMFTGKWHVGDTSAYWPEAQGYDVNRGGSSLGNPNGASPNQWYSPYRNPALTDGPVGEYLEDRLTRETVQFIRDNASRPFFITHAFYLPHVPMTQIEPYFTKYSQKNALIPRPFPASREVKYGVTAQSIQAFPPYASMVESMDEQVGRILAEVEAQGLTSKTIVVFTSDNGGYAPQYGGTSNSPLRGAKTWLYEGGIRVPLVIRAPGLVTANTASDYPTRSEDILPTLLALTQVANRGGPLDGVDVFAANRPATRDLFWHYPHYHLSGARPHGAVRSGQWKLLQFFEDDSVELYDLAADPGETTNLAPSRPDVVATMSQKLTAWRTLVGARMPTRR